MIVGIFTRATVYIFASCIVLDKFFRILQRLTLMTISSEFYTESDPHKQPLPF